MTTRGKFIFVGLKLLELGGVILLLCLFSMLGAYSNNLIMGPTLMPFEFFPTIEFTDMLARSFWGMIAALFLTALACLIFVVGENVIIAGAAFVWWNIDAAKGIDRKLNKKH